MEMQSFSESRNAVEILLISARSAHASQLSDHASNVVCTAALIYTHFVLRAYEPRFPVLTRLFGNLRASLVSLGGSMTDMLEVWNDIDSREALLWALCLGSYVSKTEEERKWIVGKARIIMHALEIRSSVELDSCLYKFAWTQRLSGKHLIEVA